MLINYDFFQHLHNIWPCLKELDISAQMNVRDFSLTLTWKDKTLKLLPQFSSLQGGRLSYAPYYGQKVRNFVGWRPYHPKSWELGTNKLLFKDYLIENGIRTPAYSRDSNAQLSNVLVKRNVSSFGHGMRGPFRSSTMTTLNAQEEEYFEEYIEGSIVKVWFWNDTAVAAEVVQPLSVFGNGKSTLIESYTRMINKPANFEHFKPFIEFRGLTFDAVPEADERCAIDYRYNSAFTVQPHAKDVRIGIDPFFDLEDELRRLGPVIWASIPEAIRDNTVYCVDGVVDEHGALWLLEINANPYVHPYVYRWMLSSWLQAVQGGGTWPSPKLGAPQMLEPPRAESEPRQ
jgi:hypothetical protein